jgi:hypothetical protein
MQRQSVMARWAKSRQTPICSAYPTNLFGVPLGGGAIATRVVISEFNVVVHIITNCLHPLPAASDIAEQPPSLIRQPLGVAVATAIQKWEYVIGQFIDVELTRVRYDFIRQTAIPDNKFVSNFEAPRPSNQTRPDVPEEIDTMTVGNARPESHAIRCQQILLT